MAHTTGRYTSSPESAARIRPRPHRRPASGDGQAFVTELDRIVAANFTNDYWEISLPNRLDTSSPRSPALFAYLAALNLLDAEVLFSDDARSRAARSSDHGAARDRTPSPVPEEATSRRWASPAPGKSTRSPTWLSSTGRRTPRSARARRSDYWPVMSAQVRRRPTQAADYSACAAGRLGAARLPDFLERRRA